MDPLRERGPSPPPCFAAELTDDSFSSFSACHVIRVEQIKGIKWRTHRVYLVLSETPYTKKKNAWTRHASPVAGAPSDRLLPFSSWLSSKQYHMSTNLISSRNIIHHYNWHRHDRFRGWRPKKTWRNHFDSWDIYIKSRSHRKIKNAYFFRTWSRPFPQTSWHFRGSESPAPYAGPWRPFRFSASFSVSGKKKNFFFLFFLWPNGHHYLQRVKCVRSTPTNRHTYLNVD